MTLVRAFLAKMVYNLPTTKDLVERLGSDPTLRRICGFGDTVASESTFGRAFAEFARMGLAGSVHKEERPTLLTVSSVLFTPWRLPAVIAAAKSSGRGWRPAARSFAVPIALPKKE